MKLRMLLTVAFAVMCIMFFPGLNQCASGYPSISVSAVNQTQGTLKIQEQDVPVGGEVALISFHDDEGLSKYFHIFQNGFWPGDLKVKCVNKGEDGGMDEDVKITLTEPTPGQLVPTSDNPAFVTTSFEPQSVTQVIVDGLNNCTDTVGFWESVKIAPGVKGNITSLAQGGLAHIPVWRNNAQGNPVTLGTLNLAAAQNFIPQYPSDSFWVRSVFTITEPSSSHLSFTLTQPYPYITFTYTEGTN